MKVRKRKHMSTIELTQDTISPNLLTLMRHLQLGETVTLVDAAGEPLALLIGVRREPKPTPSHSKWWDRWQVLAQRVDRAWKSEKSALEVLAEMRR
jgi:hypothetical protein